MSERKADPARGLFLLGLMLGGAVGAAIGLMGAPRSGAGSRGDLADWAEGLGPLPRRDGHEDEAASDDASSQATGGAV